TRLASGLARREHPTGARRADRGDLPTRERAAAPSGQGAALEPRRAAARSRAGRARPDGHRDDRAAVDAAGASRGVPRPAVGATSLCRFACGVAATVVGATDVEACEP